MVTSGFYKLTESGDALHYAPNFVQSPNASLYASQKDTYSYPVDGWTWFDTAQQAYQANNLAYDGDQANFIASQNSADWGGFIDALPFDFIQKVELSSYLLQRLNRLETLPGHWHGPQDSLIGLWNSSTKTLVPGDVVTLNQAALAAKVPFVIDPVSLAMSAIEVEEA